MGKLGMVWLYQKSTTLGVVGVVWLTFFTNQSVISPIQLKKWWDKLSAPVESAWGDFLTSLQSIIRSWGIQACALSRPGGKTVSITRCSTSVVFLSAACSFCHSSIALWWHHATADLLCPTIFVTDTDTQVCGQSRKQQMLQPRESVSGADGKDPPSAASPLAVSWPEASRVGRWPRPRIKMGSTCDSSGGPCTNCTCLVLPKGMHLIMPSMLAKLKIKWWF